MPKKKKKFLSFSAAKLSSVIYQSSDLPTEEYSVSNQTEEDFTNTSNSELGTSWSQLSKLNVSVQEFPDLGVSAQAFPALGAPAHEFSVSGAMVQEFPALEDIVEEIPALNLVPASIHEFYVSSTFAKNFPTLNAEEFTVLDNNFISSNAQVEEFAKLNDSIQEFPALSPSAQDFPALGVSVQEFPTLSASSVPIAHKFSTTLETIPKLVQPNPSIYSLNFYQKTNSNQIALALNNTDIETGFISKADSSSSDLSLKSFESLGARPKQSKSVLRTLAQEIRDKMVIKAPTRPFAKRPSQFTEGKSALLLTNHFLLKVGKTKAFHYDIDIESTPFLFYNDDNIVDKPILETINKEKSTKYTRKMATHLNRKIFEQLVGKNSKPNQLFHGIHPVYDGQKNMFTSKVLAEETKTIRLRVDLNEEGRDLAFYVNIKLAETNHIIDLDILNQYHSGKTCDDEVVKKSVLFINTLLRHNSTMSLIPIGQSIFDPSIHGQEISRFILLSYGYYSSVRNLMIGPTLNINRSAACFHKAFKIEDTVRDIIRGNLSEVPALTEYQRRVIKRELAGLQVEAMHISYGTTGNYFRKYRVLGISQKAAKYHEFKWLEMDEEGKEIRNEVVSVADYFENKYGIVLKYPHLPCLEVGNPKHKVYLPLEVCKIVSHQRLRRSLNNEERSQMTRIAGSQKPSDRLMKCKQYVNNQYHSGSVAQKNKPFLYEFGIDVSENLLEVESRIIKPPELVYNNNKTVTPLSGEWDMHTKGNTFFRPASLQKWIIINMSFIESFTVRYGNKLSGIENFAKELYVQGIEMGLKMIPQSVIVKIPNFRPKFTFFNIKARIRNNYPNLQLILFITPVKSHAFSDEIYSEIKILGDVEEGLTTQCVNIANIWDEKSRDKCQKWNRSYLRQLMLKVNPKLGGTNVALMETSAMPSIFKNKSLMIVGADVNHPAPADRITPSIAAMVGSYDNEYTNYYTTVSMQPKSREEMIKKLDQMVVELLINYRTKQKRLPQKIIFYRDGVSDGQFQHVIDNEYSLLLKAFSHFEPIYKPKITFIVVQKRHQTRFVPKEIMDSKNKDKVYQNVIPGTVIDHTITHKTDFDFYLCSHAGKLGTSRSAHYYVLADENGFNSNDMCKMTYYLCHIYQRCTKSVSIPAPVYYADLAAYRAKVHASGFQDFHSSTSSDSSGMSGQNDDEINGLSSEESKIQSYEQRIEVKANQRQRLYFC